ncbi:MAG: PleD family two-component system response regulator [Kordiimonas sp.]|nr:PleD family two-component system response regulator [Kordiimonas sp.]
MSARVLVVDDVIPNVKLLEAKLTSEYFDVVTANSGEEALARVAEDAPDIILLDVMMPGMDGFEVCRRLKANADTMHIPVIMVTALDHPRDRVNGLEAGADDFLTKPVQDLPLFARVRSLVRLKMLTDELRMRETTGQNLGFEASGYLDGSIEVSDAKILLIEDYERVAKRVSGHLEEIGQVTINDGQSDIQDLANRESFDLIIVSLGLKEMDGLRICSNVRSLETIRHLPLLVLVDEGDSQQLIRALEIGVNDYLVRPIDRLELLARAKTQVRRKRYSEQLRQNMHMNFKMAMTDAVTGLYNRHFLYNHLDTLIRSVEGTDKKVSVMMMDLDHFKAVNDQYGHGAGDEVLKELGHRISQNIRGVDMAARYGGEEFVVMMPDTDVDFAAGIAERLRASVSDTPFMVGGVEGGLAVTVSIGLACTDMGFVSSKDLLNGADKALYSAKGEGRNRVCLYGPEVRELG